MSSCCVCTPGFWQMRRAGPLNRGHDEDRRGAHDPAAAIEQPHSPFATTRIPASTASSCAPRLLEAALIYMSVFIMDKNGDYSLYFIRYNLTLDPLIRHYPISDFPVFGYRTKNYGKAPSFVHDLFACIISGINPSLRVH